MICTTCNTEVADDQMEMHMTSHNSMPAEEAATDAPVVEESADEAETPAVEEDEEEEEEEPEEEEPKETPAKEAENSTVSAFDEAVYDKILTSVAYIATTVVWMMGQLLAGLMSMLIAVVGYNGFGDSSIIDLGWPLVRDVLNMFVVIALLGIAIKNLLPGGGSAAGVQKQIVMVFFAVVLMNFSRTISLLAVDLSQVVTLTFANAVKDIAAGNLVELFSAQNIFISSVSAQGYAAANLAAVQLTGTAILKFLLILSMLIAVGAMLIAFLLRIILLWILIVLSPLAFFAMGLKGSYGFMGTIVSQWSKQFQALLLFGPVLMFFLWLSLAISSGGDLADKEGFKIPDTEVSTIIKALEGTSMMSTVIATVLLFVGLKVAADIAAGASGLGAIMKKGEGFARGVYSKAGKTAWQHKGKIAAGAAASSVGLAAGALTAGVAGASLGALTAGGAGFGAYKGLRSSSNRATRFAQGIARGTTGIAETLGRVPYAGALVRPVTNQISRAGSAADTAIGGIMDAQNKAADASIKDKSQRWKLENAKTAVDVLSNTSKAGAARRALMSPEKLAQHGSVLRSILGDKDLQKNLRSQFGQDEGDRIVTAAMKASDQDGFMDHIEDPKEKKSLKENILKTKAGNMHLLDEDARAEVINDADFKASMLSEDALKNSDVREQLHNVKHTRKEILDENGNGTGKYRETSFLDDVESGKAGTDLKNFALNKNYGDESSAKAAATRGRIRSGNLNDDDLENSSIVKQAFKTGAMKGSQITQEMISENEDELMEGVLNNPDTFDFESMQSDIRDEVAFMLDARDTGSGSTEGRRVLRAKARLDKDPMLNFSIDVNANIADKNTSRAFEDSIAKNIENIEHIDDALIKSGSDVARIISGISNSSKQKGGIKGQLRDAQKLGDNSQVQRLKATAEKIIKANRAHASTLSSGNEKQKQRASALEKSAHDIEEYLFNF